MKTAICPICEERIQVGKRISIRDRLCCPTCEALLEVMSTNPVEVDWIYYDDELKSNGKNRVAGTRTANCPFCHEKVKISSYMKVGHRVFCPGCDSILEIVSIIPLELDWPFDSDIDYLYRDHDLFIGSEQDSPY